MDGVRRSEVFLATGLLMKLKDYRKRRTYTDSRGMPIPFKLIPTPLYNEFLDSLHVIVRGSALDFKALEESQQGTELGVFSVEAQITDLVRSHI